MLGFSLAKDSFQFVEIQYIEGKPVVQRFAHRTTPEPFNLENALRTENLDPFKQIIQEAVDVFQLNGPVAVALDNRLAFVKKFLVDLAMPDDELEEQLNWEFRQIFPEASLGEYQFVYERLPGGFYANLDAVLTVAYRERLLETVQELFRPTGLQIAHVDLDIFAALYAVNRLYGIREFDLCVLADVRSDVAKLQFVRKGEFFDLHTARYSDLEENSEAVFQSDETAAKLINKELRRKLLEYFSEEQDKPIDMLFLFGDRASSDMADYLAMSPAREIILVEPFKKLEMNISESGISDEDMLSSKYTVGVGSALRTVF